LNSWNRFNIDYSYNLYEKKFPQDPSSESNLYSTIISNSQLSFNSIAINNQNNKINIRPYYDISGGAYSQNNNYTITIPFGLYTKNQLIDIINTQFSQNSQTYGSKMTSYIKNNNEYIKIYTNINIIYTTKDYKLVFYNPVDFVKCFLGSKTVKNATWDSTLGWMLGFRDNIEYELTASNKEIGDGYTYYTDSPEGVYTYIDLYGINNNIINTIINITSDTSVTLNSYNYFYILLDDYIQNQINDGLVSITSRETNIPLESYSTKYTKKICDPITNTTVINTIQNFDGLTNKQIYSVNQALISKKNIVQKYSNGSNLKDIYAIIPLDLRGIQNGDFYVETPQNQERLYFGPVNINRLSIKLINSNGDVVDLNKSDWSLTLLCEQLYKKNI
jgi:hypothetical protein